MWRSGFLARHPGTSDTANAVMLARMCPGSVDPGRLVAGSETGADGIGRESSQRSPRQPSCIAPDMAPDIRA